MTGPRAYLPMEGLRPFVQFLGGTIVGVSSDGGGATFVLSPGAGVDAEISDKLRLRAEGAVLLTARGTSGRLSAGLVVGY
jgi:hypothetical protein